MANTDGEDILFHEVRFPFAPGVTQAQVAAALAPVPDLSAEGAKRWVWRSRPVKSRKVALEGSTILGMLELRGKALVLEVNSS